ncbi:hypothetical protein [Amycolatopsis sp. NBC_01480]|uniref:hypothetical protein n=1 Tax=Amycolatopsis sp. NBC_01480 TaxID=2903562 RepID=UPI002E2C23D6|nr:hypothetical protein [Amycolatopsis sp. NBC_01480]
MADRIYTVPMTSAFDGLAHELTDEAFAESTTGDYVALCGAEIRPTPCTAPIGRTCPACLQLLLVARGLAPERPVYVTVPEQSRGRARHRRPGRLQALLSHSGRSSR